MLAGEERASEIKQILLVSVGVVFGGRAWIWQPEMPHKGHITNTRGYA